MPDFPHVFDRTGMGRCVYCRAAKKDKPYARCPQRREIEMEEADRFVLQLRRVLKRQTAQRSK